MDNSEFVNKKQRNHEVKIVFDIQEIKKIKTKAEELGLKPSQFIRMVCLRARLE